MEPKPYKKNFKINNWLFFVANRFNSVDSKGKTALTSLLSVFGISVGVATLIIVLSVMNGFQQGYISSILEVSSFHVRLKASESDIKNIQLNRFIKTIVPFFDIQALVQGSKYKQQGALIRAIDPDEIKNDFEMTNALRIIDGSFDLDSNNTIVIGNEFARSLDVSVGDSITIVALSGSKETDIFPEDSRFIISGIFKTDYYDIDTNFAFINLEKGKELIGFQKEIMAGIKLHNIQKDAQAIQVIQNEFPSIQVESWREYNHAFFGALKIEKNILLLIVILIFFVVTVNIYNGMRRSVFERKEEISMLEALGATAIEVQFIFILNGMLIGFLGATIGLLIGLGITININGIFFVIEQIVNGINVFINSLFGSYIGEHFSIFSPEYFYITEIPVEIFLKEVVFIWTFGVLSASIASWFASVHITNLHPAEVLKYE